jgi:hypothetical protein
VIIIVVFKDSFNKNLNNKICSSLYKIFSCSKKSQISFSILLELFSLDKANFLEYLEIYSDKIV